MHLLFTLVDFLFWQPGQVVGQYTTIELYVNANIEAISALCLQASKISEYLSSNISSTERDV